MKMKRMAGASWRGWWPGCVIILAALAAYHDSFSGQLVYDDTRSIVDNPSIRHLSPAALAPPSGGLTVSGRPVLNVSLALNYALSGTDVWSYHALNLLVHILAALALYGIVRRTLVRVATRASARRSLGEGGPGYLRRIDPTFCAFAIALLWAVHPLQTEAVLYVVQRAESLMGLFYLLTLYCFIRYAGERSPDAEAKADGEAGGKIWAWLSIACCLLGMGTKEVMVSAPLMVLLYDRTFVAGTFRQAWRRRRGYYAGLATTWLLLVALVAASGGNRGGTSGFGTGVGWWAYGLTQFEAVAHYLALCFWPAPLAFDYGPFWVAPAVQAVPYALVVLPLAAGTAWALLRPARRGVGGQELGLPERGPGLAGQTRGFAVPALGFAGAWFFSILAPTSLVPGGIQMIAEHRMYLPLAAVLAAATLAIFSALGRVAGLVLVLLAALGLGLATERRSLVYRTNLALWADTAAKRPGNAFAQNNLGKALFLAGRVAEAETHYARALQLDPGDALAHYNLGNIRANDGRLPEAIAEYGRALRLQPDLFEAHNNLGLALVKAGRPLAAIAEFEATLRHEPDSFEAHCNLADVLAQVGRVPESIDQYELALRLEPNAAAVHENLAMALAQAERVPEAISHFEAAVRIEPGDADLHYNLGLVLGHAGRADEARVQFETAARLHRGIGVDPGRP